MRRFLDLAESELGLGRLDLGRILDIRRSIHKTRGVQGRCSDDNGFRRTRDGRNSILSDFDDLRRCRRIASYFLRRPFEDASK
jgi:hypothetical protein